MGEKALQKKQYIVEKARNVFVEKGFKCVTMKDIVEACDISRGGLYLYFSSTEEIFEEVLKQDEEKMEAEFSQKNLQGASIADLLFVFLREQKKEILIKKDSLTVAKYEFSFVCRENGKTSVLRRQFETEALVLEKLLERGNKSQEFFCASPREEAGNMMLTIEGMKICASTMGISEKRVDREFMYMMKKVIQE